MCPLDARVVPLQPPPDDEPFVGGASALPSVCPTCASGPGAGNRWLGPSAGLTLSPRREPGPLLEVSRRYGNCRMFPEQNRRHRDVP